VDILQVLRRSWHLVWRYRVLWVFGLVLALTTASFSTAMMWRYRSEWDVPDSLVNIQLPNGSVIRVPGSVRVQDGRDGGQIILEYGGHTGGRSYRAGDIIIRFASITEFSLAVVARDNMGRLEVRELAPRPDIMRLGISVLAIMLALAAVLLLVGRVARYVAEASLLSLVDEYEEHGTRYGLLAGLRLGCSRAAWRIFCINWVVNLAVFALGLLVLVPLTIPLALWRGGWTLGGLASTMSGAGLVLISVLVLCTAGTLSTLLKPFFWRAAVLEQRSVVESVRRGWAVLRQHVRDGVMMWLLLLGVDLAWPLATAPLALGVVAIAVLLGGLSTLAAAAVGGLFLEGTARWVAAGLVVGVPVFFLSLIGPLALLNGLREVFRSSAWTITYRELRGAEATAQERLPEMAPSPASH